MNLFDILKSLPKPSTGVTDAIWLFAALVAGLVVLGIAT